MGDLPRAHWVLRSLQIIVVVYSSAFGHICFDSVERHAPRFNIFYSDFLDAINVWCSTLSLSEKPPTLSLNLFFIFNKFSTSRQGTAKYYSLKLTITADIWYVIDGDLASNSG